MRKSWTKIFKSREISIVLVLIILEVFAIIFVPNYTSLLNLELLLRAIPSLGIVSLGVCLLMVVGEFDLSVGSTFALAPMIGALLIQKGFNTWLSFLIMLVVGALIGAINGIVTVKSKAPSFIITLGAMMIWRGVVLVIAQGKSISYKLTPAFQAIFAGKVGPFAVQFIWFVFFAIIFWIILFRQKFGNWLFATGGNLRAAKAMGINTNIVKVITFIIAGIMATVGGLFDSTRVSTVHPLQGEGLALTAIAAVVIGGTSLAGGAGTIIGTFLGATIIFTINDILLLLKAEAYLFDAFVGLVIIMAVILNQFLGRREKA